MKLNFAKWKILYDPYTDFLQVYSPMLPTIKREDTFYKSEDNLKVIFDKNVGLPLMIEINSAENLFNKNLDDMTKEEILNFLQVNLKGMYAEKS